MQIFKVSRDLNEVLLDKKPAKIGFVPTMGALHEGHIALINCSKKENDITVVSIFVNPKQFNDPKDLKNYPRTIDQDIEKLKKNGCDFLFYPTVGDLYPKEDFIPVLELNHLDKVMEGKHRPGHFNGVVMVVRKLLHIIQPEVAYFGKKDFQQLAVIKYLVEQEKIPVIIKGIATIRDHDGLALSSRNQLLSKKHREVAPFIYQTLQKVKEKLHAQENIMEIKTWVEDAFFNHPDFKLEYFEIVNPVDLKPIQKKPKNELVVACIAAFLGSVRLIDNIEI